MHTITTDPNSVVLAGDLLDWGNTKVGQLRTLLLAAAGLMAIAAVLTAWWRTKSWVGTLVAFLLAALVLWGIANMNVLKTKVGSEVDDAGAVTVVQITDNAARAENGLV
ncbi:hypothetical protein [Streptomyces aureoversilis]|uniref:Uncharacterized protein n=1 Tax=Streptomyces aureoversilis TaxID=67277 RepID=A0ABW0A636_9ACTN